MSLLHHLVVQELPESQYNEHVALILTQLRRDRTPVLQLVESLGPFLTGDDDSQRARAISVLAEVSTNGVYSLQGSRVRKQPGEGCFLAVATAPPQVVEGGPATAASDGEVRHLAQFFGSRLTDW